MKDLSIIIAITISTLLVGAFVAVGEDHEAPSIEANLPDLPPDGEEVFHDKWYKKDLLCKISLAESAERSAASNERMAASLERIAVAMEGLAIDPEAMDNLTEQVEKLTAAMDGFEGFEGIGDISQLATGKDVYELKVAVKSQTSLLRNNFIQRTPLLKEIRNLINSIWTSVKLDDAALNR